MKLRKGEQKPESIVRTSEFAATLQVGKVLKDAEEIIY